MEMIPIANTCPVFQKYICPNCKTKQWIYHSRVDPKTYSWDSVEVNEETKEVKIINK